MNAVETPVMTLACLREKSRWLGRFARNIHSQTGEDGILERAIEVIGIGSQLCVDIGAWDGLHGSNTRLLICRGWESVQIEGNPERFGELARLYRDNPRVRCVARYVRLEGPDALDSILDESQVPADFGLLCIDIDGNDWHVWKSLRRHPRLVLIEYNFSVPDEVSFVQPADPSVAQGASLRALLELGREKGYELIFATGLNALFVTRELYPPFQIPDNSIEVMHVPLEDVRSHLFFGYDGTVFVRGAARAPWHNLPLPEHRLQILPQALRKTGGYNRWQRLWFLAVRARLEGNLFRPRKWITALQVLLGRQRVTNVPES